jgi:hypothetical protein
MIGASACEFATGLRQRVFAQQFRDEACNLLAGCGLYDSKEACLPTQPLHLTNELLTDCPCYDANAARDCISALRNGEGTCATTPEINYPEVCSRVCCPDTCEAAACEIKRLSPEDNCDQVLNTDFDEAQALFSELIDPDNIRTCQAIPEAPTLHFDASVERRLPEPAVSAEILAYARGSLNAPLDASFPCGDTPAQLVLCAAGGNVAGDHYVVAYETLEPLVRTSPENLYEHGFAFDGDEDRMNNFIPDMRVADDFFENTDQWFIANYNPTTGWVFRAFIARNQNVVQQGQSDARMIIRGRSVALVVPAGELESFDPAARINLFRHTGDLGLEDPNNWSGLVFPAQRQPLFRRILRRPF